MQLYIGVDMGGTSIVAGRFSRERMLEHAEVPTGANRGEKEIMRSLKEVIGRVCNNDVAGIGIGIPGIMDHETGEILLINNIPAIKGVAVRNRVSEHFGLPVFQSNDANCFTLGEAWYGAARDFRHLVGVTIGTGLGGGILIDRKIHPGLAGGAGEIGCLPFRDGIAEDYCSGSWLTREYNRTGEELYTEAKQGIAEAVTAFERLGKNIGEFLRSIMYLLAPEAFVFGGSVTRAWDFMKGAMRREVEQFPVERIGRQVKLLPAQLDNAGLYGAAALCISEIQHAP